MPSPDIRPYVDLTLDDRDAQSILDAAVADAAAKLPGWVPREGHTEVVLLEELALTASEFSFAVNRLPGAMMQGALGLFGVTRDEGAPPAGVVRFDLADAAGHDIPAGTRLQLAVGGGEPLLFTTNAALVVPQGAAAGSVGITGETFTTAANGHPAGARLDLLDALAFIDAVVLTQPLIGGRGPEDGTAYLERGVQRLRRLVSTLVLPEHFEAAALETAGVLRARAIDGFDPGSGNAPGGDPGHVTVAVLGADGAPLSADAKATLQTALGDDAQVNLGVHIIDPTLTAVDVSVAAVALPGQDAATVEARVLAALEDYLNPATWGWSATVRVNELIALVDRVEGVDYVDRVEYPAADLPLAGGAPLAAAGALSVLVTGGIVVGER